MGENLSIFVEALTRFTSIEQLDTRYTQELSKQVDGNIKQERFLANALIVHTRYPFLEKAQVKKMANCLVPLLEKYIERLGTTKLNDKHYRTLFKTLSVIHDLPEELGQDEKFLKRM